MKWENAVRTEGDTYKIPTRWLFIHYYEALNILFRIENTLRTLVYVVLKNQFKDKWPDASIASEAGGGTISSIANKRKSQAASFAYLGYPITSPLMYLTTGELVGIILSDGYWNYFNSYFLGAKSIIEAKLTEIISVRNSLAHFRPINPDDVETVKQVSKHVLTTSEKALAEMLRCSITVPTNTTDKWYTELRVLGTEHTKLHIYQNANEKWIKVDLQYTPPCTAKHSYKDNYEFNTLKLNAPAILREYASLAALATYVTEFQFAIIEKGPPVKAKTSKTVSIGFSRRTLEANQDSVKEQIERLLGSVEEETDLIKQDSLARGKLISSVTVSVQMPEGTDFEIADSATLASGFNEDDPSEWWGDMRLYTDDFVSATNTFPWMPTAIAGYQFSS